MNEDCPGRSLASLIYFASKAGMNIEGLGEKLVEEFLQLNYIKKITDFYRLKNYKNELMALEGMGEKSVNSILEAIEKTKDNSFPQVLTALGIRLVGNKVSKILSNYFTSFEELMEASYQDLVNIKDIGAATANNIIEYFKKNSDIIEELKELGINPQVIRVNNDNKLLNNKSFVLTGKLEKLTRDEATALIEKYGGKTTSSVSKNTSYILAGSDPGSKLQKAQKLNIEIINEDEFLKIIGE